MEISVIFPCQVIVDYFSKNILLFIAIERSDIFCFTNKMCVFSQTIQEIFEKIKEYEHFSSTI